MARPIVLSNGELHVGLNKYGLVHDFYYPYVGLENHAAGKNLRHKIGIWTDGAVHWLDDNSWNISLSYPHDALIGHIRAENQNIGLVIEFDDFVDTDLHAFVRTIHVINLQSRKREVRLFMHQAFIIGDSNSNTDTAQYLPDSDAILHYRGRRAFVISGVTNGKPFDQHSIGLFGIEGLEGTWRDADDGELDRSNVEHGRVDSTIRFTLTIPSYDSARIQYWIAAGTSVREALSVHKQLKESGIESRIVSTSHWWQAWLAPALAASTKIAPDHQKSFIRSVLIIKSQLDKRGAVLASTDTTVLNFSRDAYAYSWPRDGALALWPLIRLGYKDEALRFFEFSRRGLHQDGYLHHKYRADGALGSSWHSYVHEDGTVSAPIQLDETALVLFVFTQYYQQYKNAELLDEYYDSFVTPMATFLSEYIDEKTGLPKPSYDLWEEVFLSTTFSTAVAYAALFAAADLAADRQDEANAVKWRAAAGDIRIAARKHLYNTSRNSFYKGVIVRDGVVHKDDVIDTSSVFGAFMFGLFDTDSEEITNAIQTLKETFHFGNEVHGLPRYENDRYLRANNETQPNLWPITSLWLAQYAIEIGDEETAQDILSWVQSIMLPSGVLAEQVNPTTGQLLSVSPLTWSHAEYVATLLDSITEP